MTTMQEWIDIYCNTRDIYERKYRENERQITQGKKVVDKLFLCPECDRVWSWHPTYKLVYYYEFPKRQPEKICRECDGTNI